jgi:Holliday junction resolvase RusA-like endonuclease
MPTSSEVIQFFAPGEPKGQPRPRAFARRMGNKYVARVFDAGTAEQWKGAVAFVARNHQPQTLFDGPVHVSLWFHFPRPKAHFKAGDPGKGLKGNAPFYHLGKPDADNLAKAVLDCLTQMGGFWRDDAQVAHLTVRKTYAENPGCTVCVAPLEGHPA